MVTSSLSTGPGCEEWMLEVLARNTVYGKLWMAAYMTDIVLGLVE
jgi:hypothetical protein